MARNDSGLDALVAAYERLNKAGADSLRHAYSFGQVVDALSTMYTYDELGAAVGRSYATVYTYARLYRKYSSAQALVHMATELGTYDVSKLCGNHSTTPGRYVMQCGHCNSYDVHRRRETDEVRAELERELAERAALEQARDDAISGHFADQAASQN
jgi:hypothetical protein